MRKRVRGVLMAGLSMFGGALAARALPAAAPTPPRAGYEVVARHIRGQVNNPGLHIAIGVRVDARHAVRWRVRVTNTSPVARALRLRGLLLPKGVANQYDPTATPVWSAKGERSLEQRPDVVRAMREIRVPSGQTAQRSLWIWPRQTSQTRAVLMVETRFAGLLAYRRIRLKNRLAFVFNPQYYPNTATLTVKYNGQGRPGAPSEALVRIVDAAGKTFWQRRYGAMKKMAGTQNTRDARLSAPLAAGRYRVQLCDAARRDRVVALRPIYLPNLSAILTPLPKIGDNQVPAPWTALKYQGRQIACWNRLYRIGGSGVLEQLISGGRKLLAAPVRFQVQDAAGQWQNVRFSPAALTTRGKGRARWTKQATVTGVPWKLHAWLDYDGLLRCDVDVTPRQVAPTWKAIRLVIPLRAARARDLEKYWYAPHGGLEFGSGQNFGPLPKQGWTSGFIPFVTLGNLHGAFCFAAQSMRNWHLFDAARAYQITTRHGVTRLVVNFADQPLDSARARRWRFGLIASPVKPLPKDWPTRRFPDQPETVLSGVRNDLPLPQSAWNWWWSPKRADYAMLGRQVSAARALAPDVVPGVWLQLTWGPDMGWLGAYVNSWKDDRKPNFCSYENDWIPDVPERRYSTDCGFQEMLYNMIQRMIRQSHIQGVYFDTGNVWPDYNVAAGRAFVDDFGRVQPFYGIWGHRRFLQALWILFEKTGKPFFVAELANTQIDLPTITHTTEVITGEYYSSREQPARGSYIRATGSTPMESWVFHHTPTIWGTLPTFIAEPVYHTRTLLPLSLLSATPLWVGLNISPAGIRLLNRADLALAHAGVNASTFHVRVGAAWLGLNPGPERSVYASVYAMKRAAVVALSNLGIAPQKVTLTPGPRLKRLVGRRWRVRDILTPRPVKYAGGRALRILVPAEDVRLLRFTPGG